MKMQAEERAQLREEMVGFAGTADVAPAAGSGYAGKTAEDLVNMLLDMDLSEQQREEVSADGKQRCSIVIVSITSTHLIPYPSHFNSWRLSWRRGGLAMPPSLLLLPPLLPLLHLLPLLPLLLLHLLPLLLVLRMLAKPQRIW